MAKDLICGMEVKEEDAAGSSLYKGKKYYFCSEVCKQKFDENPEIYMTEEGREDEENKNVVQPEKEKELEVEAKDISKAERIDIPIVGMSCATCATTIQRGLASLKGVGKANVNFATSKATVLYQPQLVKPEDFISSVRKSGYEVGTASLELPIQGMECASCVQKIEKAILQTRGVTKAVVNLATEKAKVEYIPSETNFEEIKRAIESTGYKVLEIAPLEEVEDPERLVREREYKKLKVKFIAGVILGIFVFLGSSRHWFPWVPAFL